MGGGRGGGDIRDLGATPDWFHKEIHDYGIAALSPDRRRIAVLAATDTD
ncbi:DUF6183 family protein [Streptomyces canus]